MAWGRFKRRDGSEAMLDDEIQLMNAVRTGMIAPDTPVQLPGRQDWVHASTLPAYYTWLSEEHEPRLIRRRVRFPFRRLGLLLAVIGTATYLAFALAVGSLHGLQSALLQVGLTVACDGVLVGLLTWLAGRLSKYARLRGKLQAGWLVAGLLILSEFLLRSGLMAPRIARLPSQAPRVVSAPMQAASPAEPRATPSAEPQPEPQPTAAVQGPFIEAAKAPPPTPPGEPWASSFNLWLDHFNSRRMQLAVVAQESLLRYQTAIFLEPTLLASPATITSARHEIESIRTDLQSLSAQYQELVDDGQQELATVQIPPDLRNAMLEIYQANAPKAKAETKAVLQLRQSLLSDAQGILVFMSASLSSGTYAVKDGKVLFADAGTSAELQRRVAALAAKMSPWQDDFRAVDQPVQNLTDRLTALYWGTR